MAFMVVLCLEMVKDLEESIWNNQKNPYLTFEKFIGESLSQATKTLYCYKSGCQKSPTKCVTRAEEGGRIFYSSCPQDQKCQLLADYSGVCIKDFVLEKLTYLYPGDICSNAVRQTRICAYGPKACIEGVCMGFKLDESCEYDQDCEVGLFCEAGKCTTQRKVGDKCEYDDQCGRQALCYFGSSSITGVCMELFTINSKAKFNVFNSFKNGLEYRPGRLSHLLCKSGIALVNGTCSDGLRSPTKGKGCPSTRSLALEAVHNGFFEFFWILLIFSF